MATALKLVDTLLYDINNYLIKGKAFVDFRIEPLRPEHFKEANDIIIDAFYNRTEPLTDGAPKEMWDIILDSKFKQDIKQHNASCVAVKNGTNQVIGVVLADDMSIEPSPELIKKFMEIPATKTYNVAWIFGIIDELTKDYKAMKKEKGEFKMGDVLELQVSAVHKDYKRRGVVTRLKKHFLDIGRRDGYRWSVSEASNRNSQGQNMKIGFRIEKEIFYKEWEFGGKGSGVKPFADVVDKYGHDKLALMVCYF